MKAIDLYSGVGGWTLGLRMAGIDVVKSYEWWQPAAKTNAMNNGGSDDTFDVRQLNLEELPKEIDIVVGSPPCTQFSFSNRGGSGDIEDGLVDIERFLAVVEHVQPKFWVFENVPRVATVLRQAIGQHPAFARYEELLDAANIEVFDMSNFGLPQRRKRCIVGNLDLELLQRYAEVTPTTSLGSVIESVREGRDPIYVDPRRNTLTDIETEAPLSAEETRFNRDMKAYHPVYNGMPFPEPLDRPSRTVTATCTRVSRESLVIFDEQLDQYRRLSVRERACLQGFPVKFEFKGSSYAQKLKMIGNAIPPCFTYLIGSSMQKVCPKELVSLDKLDANSLLLEGFHIETRPDKVGRTYPTNRRFRFCVPGLRFKSGTRFELSNVDGPNDWKISFFYGDSKRIRSFELNDGELDDLLTTLPSDVEKTLAKLRYQLVRHLENLDLLSLQKHWSHQDRSGQGPFELIDALGVFVATCKEETLWADFSNSMSDQVLQTVYAKDNGQRLSEKKLRKIIVDLLIGFCVMASFNSIYGSQKVDRLAAE
ncbi:DNA (cytosine-5-)-methyltransferase [Shimia sp. SDUM112013]|uniref:DNA cytosine methyltransferase n=1 Tax=Shimia sp. SDUM112013 TaxID=3136160 RepID=UPI0032ED2871